MLQVRIPTLVFNVIHRLTKPYLSNFIFYDLKLNVPLSPCILCIYDAAFESRMLYHTIWFLIIDSKKFRIVKPHADFCSISSYFTNQQTTTIKTTNNKMKEQKLRGIELSKVKSLEFKAPNSETMLFLLYHTVDLYFLLRLYVNPFE